MYLDGAKNLDEVLAYGLNPAVELLYLIEDIDNEETNGDREIFWTLFKGLILRTRHAVKRIDSDRRAGLVKRGNN